jgi:hypothetical protein
MKKARTSGRGNSRTSPFDSSRNKPFRVGMFAFLTSALHHLSFFAQQSIFNAFRSKQVSRKGDDDPVEFDQRRLSGRGESVGRRRNRERGDCRNISEVTLPIE